ncbi:uncharacterized protein LY89DRAFT_706092 [Mollisia scopiformis]|uniref:Peptide N-acetyl-beta-D-glucosaminyl asparaginase amidase A N-terminal domain-containing protein n=1 Tax=Mollisia scopiformis TaxID=149040 RepID=A0A194XGK3_MOLSC|nr:uncharacterized protein LY89DRAFT_706092 [Mollisia scopiformis]KUJ19264.1 hypothetical protein LY89DRAFT_706092 [Mollisia scopiformis]
MFHSLPNYNLSLLLLILFSQVSRASLDVVQAQVPLRTSFAGTACKQTIFKHSFANSYGVPCVGIYFPPENCTFTTTIFNISVTSKGRQYDRLALLFFGDTEIWRTSTAMPTEEGIYWSYQKEMTVFDALLRTEQKVIFDLSSFYSDLYTGAFNVTLEALYYKDNYVSGLSPPDRIYPISALASAQNISSVMSLPDDNGTVSITFPRNVKTATVSILASGNSAEEFWYTNVPSEYVDTFPGNPGWLYGYSPFREVQLLIDGKLTGVSWPFPLLFTGGVDPGLWRPIVGIDAYDLPTFDIDVTPWLSLLCDGRSHDFGLKVVGFDNSAEDKIETVGENWWVTGAVYIWLDDHGNQTLGGNITTNISPPTFSYHPILTSTTTNGTKTNTSFYFSLTAHRTLAISSTIRTSTGSKQVSWKQNLSFSNIQNMTDLAYNQSLSMLSTGSYSDSFSGTESTYSYPINLYSAYVIAPTTATLSSVFTLIDRSLITKGIDILSSLTGLTLGSESLATRQFGESMYYWNETIVEGTAADTGVTEQWFSYSGHPGLGEDGVRDFSRHLKEVDDAIVTDDERWETMVVPNTKPLPYVEGEPVV